MSPAGVLPVLVVSILRVENQNIAIAQELDQFGASFCCYLSRRFRTLGRLLQVQVQRIIRFVVREESDRTATGEETVAYTNAGMIEKFRAHAHLADLEFHLLHFLDLDLTGEVAQ